MIGPSLYNSFLSDVQNLIKTGKIDLALNKVKEFVEIMMGNPYCGGVIFGFRDMDRLCQLIGNYIALNVTSVHPTNSTLENKNVIYLASHLYITGGHTAIIEDFIKAQPELQHHIVITDVFNNCEKTKINKRFELLPVTLHWASRGKLITKLIWVKNKWHHLNPKKVFLFNHNQDSVAIAAASEEMPGSLYYYHHFELFGLGLHIPHAIHIDFFLPLHSICTTLADKKKHIYLPLTCYDKGYEVKNYLFKKNHFLNTASSGAAHKFLTSYKYSYVDLIPEILKATNGIHTHIGELPDEIIQNIEQILKKNKIKKNRFIHIPYTSDLWTTLQSLNIDLYIVSFPLGGGRAGIEVMGAGIPIIMHVNEETNIFDSSFLLYPDVMKWRKPFELFDLLRHISVHQLTEHSNYARSYYEKNHSHKLLSKRLSNNVDSPEIIYECQNKNLINEDLNLILINSTLFYAQMISKKPPITILINNFNKIRKKFSIIKKITRRLLKLSKRYVYYLSK